jgi:hypothetical protein
MDTLLVSRKDAAAALGICLRTLDYLILSKELIPRRIGRRVMFERSALERFARRDHPFLTRTTPSNVGAEHAEGTIPAREPRR